MIRSDCADVQADLNLRRAHMSECTFSEVADHFLYDNLTNKIQHL